MLIGAKYRLKKAMLGNSVGAVGYVFNEYQDIGRSNDLGIQIIFSNGEYDGFSAEEQESFLEFIGFYKNYSRYHFENVVKVSDDFKSGYWKWDND